MEVFVAIAAKMVEYTVAPVGQWLRYSFRYSSNIAKMKSWEEMLQDARDRVQHSIDTAVRNGEEIEADVNKWLTEVDEITELAKKVHEGEEEAKMRCSIDVCLSLKLRHQLSRKAKNLLKAIDEALENGKFDRISHRPASQGIVTTRNIDCMEFVSRMPTMKGLKEALGDANINVIGLWGMPGVGKTTLMREVARQVKEEDKLFDEVALAYVTQSQDLRRIQGEIADMLDLKLDDAETLYRRAIRLRQRLTTKEKRILVILDDMWEKLDLEAIGIDPWKGCKVVLVSRQRNFLSEMGVQKDFGIEVLPEKEAWELFEKMAGDSVKDPNLRVIATEVAKECDGLPIAIATVSKALNNKDLYEWKEALQQLRRPAPEHLTIMQSTIYSCIELSFRHLESREIQYLFLHCAEMEFGIYHQDLLKYCYGLGLFQGINTLEDARNRLHGQLRNLKDSCLLQDCPDDSRFCRMHNVVRNVATLIALKDYDMLFMRDDGGLKEWPDMDALKRCKAFSIRGGDIHQLPKELECPELRFLYVNGRDRSLQIPDTFFQGMEKLKVLDLTAMKLSSLPSSLLLPRNLQTLCLDQCELGDISGIGELKNLVVLSLLYSNISTLPREIGSLVRLRLLDLSNCSKLEVIPPNVLSSLVELEELYMENSFVQWEAEGLITERSNNANLAELKHMSRLTTLEIHIQDACMLSKDLWFGKLERYNILVGDVYDWSDKHECSRTLKLKLNTSFQSEVGIKMLLNRTECLYLDELKGVKSVLHELDREGFQQLKHLHIQNNDEIKYIIINSPDNISTISFPALETFLLKNMTGLEDICHGQLLSTSFRNLRVVKVENCEKLKFVFPSSVARGLSQLQELQIRECSNMGAILVKEGGEIGDTDTIFFPQLHCLALKHLPKLMSFLTTKNSLGTEAGEIVLERTLDFDMPILHEQGEPPSTSFQKLRVLELENCEKLRFVFSSSIASGLSLLEKLEIKKCNNMGAIVVKEEKDGIEDGDVILFHQLQTLVLEDLPELVSFLSTRSSFMTDYRQIIAEGNRDLHMPLLHHQVSFPSLQTLRMKSLPKIKHVWNCGQEPETVFRCLEQLKIENCGVEEIVAGGGGGDPVARTILVFPRVSGLKLINLKRLKWFYKGVHVSKWPMLENMRIERCEKVEIFASGLVSFEETVEERSFEMSLKQPLFLVDELSFLSLKKLVIENMEKLEIIWQDQVAASSFSKNIQDMEIDGCEKLLHVFQSNVLTQSLTRLCIWDCSSLETIFRNMEGHNGKESQVLIAPSSGTEESVAREDETARHIEFPILTEMRLVGLPKLKWILEGVHTNLECPLLEKLELSECDQVIWASKFASSSSSQETSPQNQLQTCIQLPLPNLMELQVWYSGREEIFPYELVDPVPRLRRLQLYRLPMLTHLWKEDSTQPCPLFHNLEFLLLLGCSKLKNIVPSSVLQNLTELDISCCDGLINLLTSSTAKTLVQLQKMTLTECERITEIVAMEDGEANVAITFHKLAYLKLEDLPNLTHFCSGPNSFGFPSLKNVIVTRCPEMKPFCHGVSGTPVLKGVYHT